MSSGVNMFKNSLKISDTTKKEFLDVISFKSDEKIWQKYSRAYLSDPLTRWLSINVLTRGF